MGKNWATACVHGSACVHALILTNPLLPHPPVNSMRGGREWSRKHHEGGKQAHAAVASLTRMAKSLAAVCGSPIAIMIAMILSAFPHMLT